MQQEPVMNESTLDAIGEYLQLSTDQQAKFAELNNGVAAVPAASLAGIVIDEQTDHNGYLRYERSVPTIVPVRFNARGTITLPEGGSWDVSVHLNGRRIFHSSNARQGQEFSVSGRTGWGSSRIVVTAQWSERRQTRIRVQVNI